MRFRIRSVVACLLLFSSVVCFGCGSNAPIGTVQGKVTLNGQPINGGRVVMVGEQPPVELAASIEADGSYKMRSYESDGLPPGRYKVAVSSQGIADGDEIALAGSPAPPEPAGPKIPRKYESVETSGLTADVKPGDNPPFNFDLTP
jgi:hypothetical protein